MKFPCPHCHATLEALPEHEGAAADCGLCGGKFTVPAAGRPATKIAGIDPGELLARGLNTIPAPDADGWEPPEPEELSRLLPQYKIECILGRGGMGAVYKGSQSRLGRNVAIKLLPAELAEDENFVARFEREAKTLAHLDHPGIIQVYDFGQTSEGHLYFVMEYIDGTDLHQMIHGLGLTPPQVLEIIGQVCDALQFAHTKGVVHRDIKPANILVTQDGRVKLCDFGLARPMKTGASGALTLTRVVMGTPDYMAPEQKRGEGDHRVDLYALGVMLYEMLCGRTPQGAWQAPSQRVQVDVRLDQVVIRAMQEEPERRYQHASEVRTDVDFIRDAIATAGKKAPPSPKHGKKDAGKNPAAQAPGSSMISHAPQPPSPSRRIIAIAAACLLPLLLLGAWFVLRKPAAHAVAKTSPADNAISQLQWQLVPMGNSYFSQTPETSQNWRRLKPGSRADGTVDSDRGAVRIQVRQLEPTYKFGLLLALKTNLKFSYAMVLEGDDIIFGGKRYPHHIEAGAPFELSMLWDQGLIRAFCNGKYVAAFALDKPISLVPCLETARSDRDDGQYPEFRQFEWTDLKDLSREQALAALKVPAPSTAPLPETGNMSPAAPAAATIQWTDLFGSNGPSYPSHFPGADGWITLDGTTPATKYASLKASRGVIRWKARWMANTRVLESSIGDGGDAFQLYGISLKQNTAGFRDQFVLTHPKTLMAGDEIEEYMAWIGNKLYTWVDGRKLGELTAKEIPKNFFMRLSTRAKENNESIQVRDIQWADLSGMADEDAIGLISKAATSQNGVSLPGTPALSQTPVEKNAARAPTTWKPLYDASHPILNASQRPDADGWATLANGTRLPGREIPSPRGAIRVRVRWTNSSQGFNFGISPKDDDHVQVLLFKSIVNLDPKVSELDRLFRAGDEMVLCHVWLGTKASTWINGVSQISKTFAFPPASVWMGSGSSITGNIQVRDIEWVDFNGVPDTEVFPFIAAESSLPGGIDSPKLTGQLKTLPSRDFILQRSQKFGGHTYGWARVAGIPWAEADDFSRKMGGHLVTITSADEQNWLKARSAGSSWSIGGRRKEDVADPTAKSNFAWITGEPMIFDAWGEKEPKNSREGPPNPNPAAEPCMAVNTNFAWVDSPLKNPDLNGFIIEWDSEINTPVSAGVEVVKPTAFAKEIPAWKPVYADGGIPMRQADDKPHAMFQADPTGWIKLKAGPAAYMKEKKLPSARGAVRITARWTAASQTFEFAKYGAGDQIRSIVINRSGAKLWDNMLNSPFKAGDVFKVTLAWTGNEIHGWLGDRKIGSTSQKKAPDFFGFRLWRTTPENEIDFRDLEWLDLSSMSDEEAVKFVSEQAAAR